MILLKRHVGYVGSVPALAMVEMSADGPWLSTHSAGQEPCLVLHQGMLRCQPQKLFLPQRTFETFFEVSRSEFCAANDKELERHTVDVKRKKCQEKGL